MTTLPLRKSYAAIAFFGLLWVLPSVNQTALAQRIPPTRPTEFVAPIVFQAAGPNAASIQARSMRSARLWETPTTATTRGRSQAVAARSTGTAGATTSLRHPGNAVRRVPGHPRRPVHHTGGTGLIAGSSCRRSGSVPAGGLAGLFNNPTYGDIFSTFSPQRLFTPVGSNITEGLFFIPGTNGS